MSNNLIVTQGLGSAGGAIALSVLSFTPNPGSLVIVFSDLVSLTGDAASSANWSITPGIGLNPITINSVSVVGNTVTVNTSEHQTGSYTLNYPQGIVSYLDGSPFVGPFTHVYSNVGVIPFLTMVRGVDARALDVVFSEAVNLQDALTPSNYTITGPSTVTVTSVEKQTDQAFRLNTTVQVRNGSYVLQASNIRDLAGNAI